MNMLIEGGSLISNENTWMLWGILAVIVAISVFLEQRYKWALRFSAPVIAIIIAFILANAKIIPTTAAVYDAAGTYCIPLATAMMLYQANAKNILKNSGKMFICMNFGIVATLIGGVVGFLLLKNYLTEGVVFSAAAVASYIGGTANFVAVGTSNGLSNDMITVGAFTENFVMTLCIIVLLWMPTSRFFQKHYPHPYQDELTRRISERDAEHGGKKVEEREPLSLLDISKCVGVALLIVAVSTGIGSWLGELFAVEGTDSPISQLPSMIFGNTYVIMTILAVVLVGLFPRFFNNMKCAHEVGTFVMYLYFAVIGCTVDLRTLASNVIPALLIYFVIGALNIGILLLVGKLTRQNIEEITIASNACIGGPFTAMAMANTKGYQKLVVPALLSGIWGNMLGTILGVIMISVFNIL